MGKNEECLPIAVCCRDARGDGEAIANRLDLVHVVLLHHVIEAVVKIVEKKDDLVRAAVLNELVEGDDVGKEDGGLLEDPAQREGASLLHQVDDRRRKKGGGYVAMLPLLGSQLLHLPVVARGHREDQLGQVEDAEDAGGNVEDCEENVENGVDVVAARQVQFLGDEAVDLLGDVLNHEAKVVGVAKKIDKIVDGGVDRSDHVVLLSNRPLDVLVGVILADVMVFGNE